MKGSTKAVGGSPTSAGAKDFTSFLTQGLGTGSFGNNAIGQTMGMGGALNNMLNGNVGDPTTLTNYFRQGTGMANIGNIGSNFQAPAFSNVGFSSLPQFNSQYSAPSFQGVNLQQLLTQLPQNIGGVGNLGQVGQVGNILGQLNTQAPTSQIGQINSPNVNLQQLLTGMGGVGNIPQIGNPNVNLQQLLSQLPSGIGGVGNLGQVGTNAPGSNVSSNYNNPAFVSPNLNGPQQISAQQIGNPNFQGAFNAVNQASGYSLDDIKNVMNQDLQSQISQARGSLQGTGTGFMSSAGALGEALLRRDAPSRLGLTLSQIGDTKAQQALSLLGIQNQAGLGNAGNALQAAIANQGAGSDFNNQLLSLANMQNQFNQGGAQFGAGQNLQAQLANVQNQLQGFGLQQAGQGQNIQNQLANQGLINSAGLQGMGLSNDAVSQLNQQMLQLAGLTQQGQGMNVSNLLANQGLNLQGAGMSNDAMNQMNQLQFQLAQLGQSGQAQNIQNQLASQGLNLQGFGMGNDAMSQMNQAMLQLAGMNQGAQGTNIQNQLANQGLINSSGLQGFGLRNDAMSQMNQAMMQMAGMGNNFAQANAQNQAQFAQGAAGMNMDAMNQLNQLMLQQSLAGNQFNQGNAQFGASQDMNAQIQNIQNLLNNQQMGNQNALGFGGLFSGFQQNQIGAQQNTLGMLFNAFNQLNALGTPQAQMVQQKSPFEQITGAIGNIGQGLAPFMMGGISIPGLGGGGIQIPSPINMPLPSNFPQYQYRP